MNPISGLCRASSAIRCCFVDTSTGFDAPAMFPSNGVMTRRPLPSAGSLGMVPPASSVLWDAPTPRRPSRPASLPSRGDTTVCARVCSPRSRASPPGAWGVVGSGLPSRKLRWRRRGLPGSWGTLVVIARALRPRPDRSRSVGPSVSATDAAPAYVHDEGSRRLVVFGAQSHGL